MFEASKKRGKEVEAYRLGSDSPIIRTLTAEGKIVDRGDGTYEIRSREAGEKGEIAKTGDYVKIDPNGDVYPNRAEWFNENHRHIAGDKYEQIPKPLKAWDAKESDCPEIQYLVENGKLSIHPDDPDHFYSAELWGTMESAAKDAVIIFYGVDYDKDGKVMGADFNFVARDVFEQTYNAQRTAPEQQKESLPKVYPEKDVVAAIKALDKFHEKSWHVARFGSVYYANFDQGCFYRNVFPTIALAAKYPIFATIAREQAELKDVLYGKFYEIQGAPYKDIALYDETITYKEHISSMDATGAKHRTSDEIALGRANSVFDVVPSDKEIFKLREFAECNFLQVNSNDWERGTETLISDCAFAAYYVEELMRKSAGYPNWESVKDQAQTILDALSDPDYVYTHEAEKMLEKEFGEGEVPKKAIAQLAVELKRADMDIHHHIPAKEVMAETEKKWEWTPQTWARALAADHVPEAMVDALTEKLLENNSRDESLPSEEVVEAFREENGLNKEEETQTKESEVDVANPNHDEEDDWSDKR